MIYRHCFIHVVCSRDCLSNELEVDRKDTKQTGKRHCDTISFFPSFSSCIFHFLVMLVVACLFPEMDRVVVIVGTPRRNGIASCEAETISHLSEPSVMTRKNREDPHLLFLPFLHPSPVPFPSLSLSLFLILWWLLLLELSTSSLVPVALPRWLGREKSDDVGAIFIRLSTSSFFFWPTNGLFCDRRHGRSRKKEKKKMDRLKHASKKTARVVGAKEIWTVQRWGERHQDDLVANSQTGPVVPSFDLMARDADADRLIKMKLINERSGRETRRSVSSLTTGSIRFSLRNLSVCIFFNLFHWPYSVVSLTSSTTQHNRSGCFFFGINVDTRR